MERQRLRMARRSGLWSGLYAWLSALCLATHRPTDRGTDGTTRLISSGLAYCRTNRIIIYRVEQKVNVVPYYVVGNGRGCAVRFVQQTKFVTSVPFDFFVVGPHCGQFIINNLAVIRSVCLNELLTDPCPVVNQRTQAFNSLKR